MKRIPTHVLVLVIAAAFCGLPATTWAQKSGTVVGHVVDATSGDPVVGATVRILNQKLGASTTVDGTYTIRNVPAGEYTISYSSVGYGAKNIEGITVKPGATLRQDVTLSQKVLQGRTVTVTAQAASTSENAVLAERRRSATVSDGISADQISRSSASDAGDAMKRVTGVSVIGNKYVVVRGLSERYSATQLNGIDLPSPEPEKKVVPFDLFPSSMLNRLTTIKTFTPDNPGDFAGGLVKIDTREFPEHFLFSLTAGTSANTESQFGSSGLSYPGGGLDWLGLDDGTRQMPANLPGGSGADAEAARLAQFSDVYTPHQSTLPVNRSFSLSVGDQADVGFPVGYLLSTSYTNGYSLHDELERYPLLATETNGLHDLRYDFNAAIADQSVLWGGLASISARFSPSSKVSFKAIVNRSSDDEARRVEGDLNLSTTGELLYTRLRFTERSLTSLQLNGEHQLAGLLDSKLQWHVARSMAGRSEPDTRSVSYVRNTPDQPYEFASSFGGNNSRFFSTLDDGETNVGLDWTVPVSLFGDLTGKIKVGGLERMRSRDFAAHRFVFFSKKFDASVLALPAEELFTPQNVRDGYISFVDQTRATDGYNADETISAGYAMIDLPITASLRFIGGARLENWDLGLTTVHPTTGVRSPELDARRSVLDVLPSINLVYTVAGDMNVRASATQTVARPEFRELAPFGFEDYRQYTFGNPGLTETKIVNLDLRWEWFPRGGEVLAVSGFYKNFDAPIEQFYRIGSSGPIVEPVNAPGAWTYGAEFEARKALDFIADGLSDFSIGANLTLVQSHVSFENASSTVLAFDGRAVEEVSPAALTSSTRPLQGQSPFVVNAQLGYGNYESGTTATLLYNVFGARLSMVGTNGVPDTYEQPRSELDFTISQRLPAGLMLKFAANNLLDAQHVLRMEFPTGEQIDVERYDEGRSFSLGLSFSVDQLSAGKLD